MGPGKNEAAIQLEQLWEEMIETRSLSLLCAYPMAYFNRDEHTEPFLKICESHSGVIPDESYTALNSEEERLRTITNLQQRAQRLENEKRTGSKLRRPSNQGNQNSPTSWKTHWRACNGRAPIKESSGPIKLF